MTVKELVFKEMYKFYKREHLCDPPKETLDAYNIGASIADMLYYKGYQKGLSDAQIGGYRRCRIIWKGA